MAEFSSDDAFGGNHVATARLLADKGAAAARFVKRHATSAEDEALLLDMLGLSGVEDAAA